MRAHGGGGSQLSWPQWRFLGLLGLPAFALAGASTVVSTYLPVFIEELSGPGVTGLLIGAEGIFGLCIPLLLGPRADRGRPKAGMGAPLLLAATGLAVVSLVLMPFAGSLVGIAVGLALFYVAYFGYYTPYWALYPALVEPRMRGRAVGLQGTWRGLGLAAALVGGGILIALWRPLPFIVAAIALTAVTLAFARLVERSGRRAGVSRQPGPTVAIPTLSLLRRHPEIRALLIANSLWEFAIAALKTFVVLFFTIGLGRSFAGTSAVLALVAAAALVAAPVSGLAADRFGHQRVVNVALWIFGLGLLLPLVSLSGWVVALVPLVAFAAVVVMTLPYSLLMRLMPPGRHGAAAGLYGFSHGLGTLLGPLIAGVAIELSAPVLTSTRGYAAVFAVSAAAIFASLLFLRRARDIEH